MITPLDIQNKEFQRGIRGYKEDDVDQFLDLITLDYEKMIQDNNELKEELRQLKDKLEKQREQELLIKDTLDTARGLMNDIAVSAEKRAEFLVRTAELDAERIRKEATEFAEKTYAEHEDLKNRLNIFVTRYRNLVEAELERFSDIEDRIFGDEL